MGDNSNQDENLPVALPWCTFPKDLLSACKAGKRPAAHDRRLMVVSIAKYMIKDLKTTSRPMIRTVARQICMKYPSSFGDRLGSSIIGDGIDTLVKQIANRCQHEQLLSLPVSEIQRKRTKNLEDDADIMDRSKKSKSKALVMTDEYGCVAYQPGLPAGETDETQRAKKKILFEVSLIDAENSSTINKAMLDTFPTQRAEINNRGNKTVKEVINQWPVLQSHKYFYLHAEILLGKKHQSILNEFRGNLAVYFVVHDFIKGECLLKIKKTKNNPKADPNPRASAMMKIIKESNAAATNLGENWPTALAIFPLILEYFEEENRLFTVVDATTTEAEIEKMTQYSTPFVVIKGDSLYSKHVRCLILIDGKICLQSDKALSAILKSFLCYFIFGLEYPLQCMKTLEFIQRALLSINPQGVKRITKAGKKPKTVNSAVKKFINALQDHINMEKALA